MNQSQIEKRDNKMQIISILIWRGFSILGILGAVVILMATNPLLLVISAPLCVIVGVLLWMGNFYTKSSYFTGTKTSAKFLQRLMYRTTSLGVGLLGVAWIINPEETKILLLISGVCWGLAGTGGLFLEPEVVRLEEE